MGGEQSDSSPLMAPAPAPIAGPSEIDLEGGPDEQIQCRICLETDGRDFIAPCKCKGTAKYVHRECLDHWRAVKEGFAFAHCTTCKAPYYIRVHGVADRNWGTLKFRFFVTRDILFLFFTVQLVIALLGYLVYLIDCYQKFWLRHIWGFHSELSFYYICGNRSYAASITYTKMSSTFERNSKGHIQRSTKFIAPRHLARTHTHMHGQKSKRIIGYPEARRPASDTFLESEDEDEKEVHPNIKKAISAHNIILHFGKHKLEESGFTEDSCFLDILKMCQKFIDIYSVGYEVTNGDGRPMKNDRDVLALFEEHEYVEDIEIYLDIKEAAQPLPFKMPQDNPTFGVISKVPEVKDVFLLGEYKSSKQVTVKGDVIDGTEEASTVEFFIAKHRHFKVDADLQAISECTNNKEFEIPRATEGHYLVAKFTPKSVDGKSGKPRYAITDTLVEDSTSQKARNARAKNKNKKVATLKSGE